MPAAGLTCHCVFWLVACCVMDSLISQAVAADGADAPGLTLTCRASNASPLVITAHRMRASRGQFLHLAPNPPSTASAAYVFTGYTDAASGNCKPTVMDALHAGVHQPVGTAASGRGIKLGGTVLAMDASMASYMNFHRSTPWRRQVS